jgi:hypothetical protein
MMNEVVVKWIVYIGAFLGALFIHFLDFYFDEKAEDEAPPAAAATGDDG